MVSMAGLPKKRMAGGFMFWKKVEWSPRQGADELRSSLGWSVWGLEAEETREAVRSIIEEVRSKGDQALVELTRRYDGVDITSLGIRVGEEEMAAAEGKVAEGFPDALRQAARNIQNFHRHQVVESFFFDGEEGMRLGQLIRPLERVGCYIPGGRASYPSTVLMTVIPARVAGVREIAACVPPRPDGSVDPHTLYALSYLKVKEVYRVGGAQAVAALALGTETIRPVDKIVGPGNAYVTAAKRELFGMVGIDMLAGPSELVVLAEGNADPDRVAYDLLAQLEHGPGTKVCLVTPSEELASAVERVLSREARPEAFSSSLVACVLVGDLEEGLQAANALAPEHFTIFAEEVADITSKVKNAGAVFLGADSPVALGDYAAGTNHVLPTGGTARFASPLGVYDFVKRTNVIYSNPRANRKLMGAVVELSRVEGLPWHGESMRKRQA